jgi:hypothetical protein
MSTTQKRKYELLNTDLIIVGDIPGGGSTPSGTGYAHVTSGVFDSPAVSPIPQADVATLVTDLAAKLVKASNLSDLTVPATARINLGLGDAATKNTGTSAGTVAAGDDSRLTDSRTPLAHKTSHQSGGSDELSVLGLFGLLGDPQPINRIASANVTLSDNYCMVVTRKYKLGAGIKLKLGDGSIFRMI